jgi:hypothetical protein
MMNLSLDDLIQDLEKSAGLTKSASEKSEKDEKKDEEKAETAVCKADEELDTACKADQAAKKENAVEQKDDKKKDDEQTKEAAAKGAALAKEVMQKVASIKLDQVNTEDTMNKQAADAGKALAEALLEKLASVGDQNTMNGIASGVPNKTQVDLAAQVAEQDSIIQNQPGTDGRGNGGTINQIFDAIVSDAMAHGAAPVDQNPAAGIAKEEGAQVAAQTPNQGGVTGWVDADQQEKAAAVSELVSQGFDFDAAVNLVKEAAFELEQEEETQVKQAAFDSFLAAGFDFDQAVELTKVAAASGAAKMLNEAARSVGGGAATRAARKAATTAEHVGRAAKKTANGVAFDANRVKAQATQGSFKALANNKAVHLGAGAAAAGAAGAYAVGREKKAALDMLIANGVDFDSAIEMVNAKSNELYGY